jgi:hypothetical protein
MKTSVLWDIRSHSPVNFNQHFGGHISLSSSGPKIKPNMKPTCNGQQTSLVLWYIPPNLPPYQLWCYFKICSDLNGGCTFDVFRWQSYVKATALLVPEQTALKITKRTLTKVTHKRLSDCSYYFCVTLSLNKPEARSRWYVTTLYTY